MRCPSCGGEDDRVVDSRAAAEANAIRRRRECLACAFRFTTYERVEELLQVVKEDGQRQPWDRRRVLEGIRKACEKRPVSARAMEEIADLVQREAAERGLAEVSSREVGVLVMRGLRPLDPVAYIRFAAYYLDYADVSDFAATVERLAGTGVAGSE